MSHLQKQTDEILALQSIFEERFHSLDHNRYELLIDWDLSSEVTLHRDTTNATLRHLPPLSLTIQYHDDYPSHSPPTFLLSCFYLSKSNLTRLCQLLDNYPFTTDEVCVYEWTEAIKADHITDINLIPDDHDLSDQADPRAVTSYSNERLSRIFHDLIEYDRERDDEEFRHHLQICCICTDEIPGASCIRLRRCGHFYCRSCLDSHVRFSLEQGHFGERLCCPQTQCQQVLLPTEIEDVIRDPQIYQRYERVTLQHGLEAMKDILWCPRCQEAVIGGAGDDNLAMCDRCRYTFCKKCKETFHSQTMCPRDYLIEQLKLKRQRELDRLRLEQEAAVTDQAKAKESKAVAATKQAAKQPYRSIVLTAADEDRLIQEVLTAERMDLLNTQPCPGCNIRIEKNGGCSHMHCSRCNLHFTWKAQAQLSAPIPGLFITTASAQFTEVETVKEELEKLANKASKYVNGQTASAVTVDSPVQQAADEEDAVIVVDNRSSLGAAMLSRVKKCPSKQCHILNVRLGNDNLISCSECQKPYCFLCGKRVNGERHFAKKCQRYT